MSLFERIVPHASAMALAAVVTTGLLGGVNGIASHEHASARAEVLAAAARSVMPVAAAEQFAVQRIEIVGHRRHA
jgi:Na+-translocating ferredoxin:NAD+ oxidoreductase RnfG subunit